MKLKLLTIGLLMWSINSAPVGHLYGSAAPARAEDLDYTVVGSVYRATERVESSLPKPRNMAENLRVYQTRTIHQRQARLEASTTDAPTK